MSSDKQDVAVLFFLLQYCTTDGVPATRCGETNLALFLLLESCFPVFCDVRHKRCVCQNPDNVIFVMDASIGQACEGQAKAFKGDGACIKSPAVCATRFNAWDFHRRQG